METSMELRQLRLSELFTRSARILRAAPAVILGCAVLELAVLGVLPFGTADGSTDWIAGLRDLLLGVAAIGGIHALLGGVVALAVSDLYTGRRERFASLAREIAARGVSIFVTGALAAVFLAIGCALLLIPGVIGSLRWIYVVPVMAVERRYGAAALRRSSELSRARSGSALVLLLAGLAPGIVLLWLPGEGWASWLVEMGMCVGWSGVLSTLIGVGYLDARARTESLSGEVLADQREGWSTGFREILGGPALAPSRAKRS